MPAPARPAVSCPTAWTEAVLLDRVLGRDERAWAELIRRHQHLIRGGIARVTGRHARGLPRADDDEIYAEVLVALVRDDLHALRRYDPRRGAIGAWLGMIAIHCAYDHLRAAARRPPLGREVGRIDAEDDSDRGPLDRLIEQERWAHLEALVAGLSARDRTFVALYFGQGLEPGAVADRMAISLTTVYSKKHKIRARLRRRLRAVRRDSPIADLLDAA